MPTATYKNLAGLSPEKIALLEKDFAGLNEAGSDLAERSVRYVVDGDDPGVLEALSRAHNPAERLRLLHPGRMPPAAAGDSTARVGFFSTIDAVGPEPYLRLAKVYEAAAKGGPPVDVMFQDYYSGLLWLELFLAQASRDVDYTWRKIEGPSFPLPLLEQMLEADGQDPALLIKFVFSAEPQGPLRSIVLMSVTRLPGFRECVLKHRDVVVNALLNAEALRKVELLNILAERDVAPNRFLKELVRLVTCSAKTVREATAPLLNQVREQARPLIEHVAIDGKPPERAAAIRWLGRYVGEASRSFLLERQQVEKVATIHEAISDALIELGQDPPIETTPTLPALSPLPSIETQVPLTPSARQAVATLIEAYNRAAADRNEALAKHRLQYPQHAQPESPIFDQLRLEQICCWLEELTDAAPMLEGEPALPLLYTANMQDPLLRIAQHPDVRLIHLLRLLTLTGYITARHWARRMMIGWTEQCLQKHGEHHSPGFTLRELAATLAAIGLDTRMIGYDILSGFPHRFQRLSAEFADYFSDHLDLLETALDNRPLAGKFDYEWRGVREKVLGMISRFPQIPPSLVGRIWQIAIGTGKTDRAAAQRLMERVPDVKKRLADALASADYQTRVVAAEWLGRMRDRQATALLHKSLAKEKQDAAKDAMLTALERLGEPIDRYLDRDQLLGDAERGLKKGLHKDLDWFPIDSWPQVRWQHSRKPVPVEILNWFLMQTYKLGSPEAGALLWRYCQQFRPQDRESLGMFALRSWLEHDLRRTYTEAEARRLAKQQAVTSQQQAKQAHLFLQQAAQQNPQMAAQYNQMAARSAQMANLTVEELEDFHYKMLAAQCNASAIKQKGILALAAACCGDEAVKIVGEYLKQWYGYRAAQCRALIAMLASLDRPDAIQLLLSVANRFRTKSIREEAEKYVKLVAERKGWSIDELADRTVPTAGFDDTRTIELDYGPRQLTARLRPDFSVELTDENGKTLKSLPEPRKDDDADKAKAAKKQLSAAKSELKKLLAQQTARLYEAMCTERVWSYADWETYLRQHPIVGQLCQRLVWGVFHGDRIAKTFRPLDDGTLTDENDGQVVVPTDARLKLAHGSLLSQESSAAWTQHLADYEVEPLFQQFGRKSYALPDDKKDATELTDFEGHLIEAFKLRGHATRLGYTRGPAQDGGWFYEYEKTLAGMGLKVVLRFSGNGMPEQNRTVALMDLHFSPTGGESAGISFDQPGIPLRDVPGVLLSECFHDLATIASAGSGYDADWQKKVGM